MDAETRAELEMLRERAYGRASDIEEDPAALRRLAELEARAAAHQPPGGAAPAPVEPEPEPGPEPAAAPEEESVALGSEAPVPDGSPEPPASALPRWVKTVAPLAAVALVAVTALVTTLIVSAGSPYAGMQRADHLHLLDSEELADLPPIPFRGYDRRFKDFLGYAVTAGGNAWDRGEYQCLTVSSANEADPTRVDSNSVCAAEPFPLTVTIVLSDRSPAEALEAHPEGTAFHFALNGSGVDVYVAEP